jgi:hypothetical protein
MSRLRIDHDLRLGRSTESSAGADEGASRGRSGVARHDEARGASGDRRPEDPSGRRSLTGLEFRRQRSI